MKQNLQEENRVSCITQTYRSSFETSKIPKNTGNHWCFLVAGPQSTLNTPYVCWRSQEWRQPQRHPRPPQSHGLRESEHMRRKPVGNLGCRGDCKQINLLGTTEGIFILKWRTQNNEWAATQRNSGTSVPTLTSPLG